MALSLHAAIIPSFVQIIDAAVGMIDKAETFCAERSLDPADVLEARLISDMLPFAYQVKSMAVHSLGAIDGVRRGQFSPDTSALATSFAGLRDRLAAARTGIEAVSVDEMESFIGRDMAFVAGERRMRFTAEHFLLSFSQPNFYFHAATSYDILRARGVPIGKRDFLGAVRMRE